MSFFKRLEYIGGSSAKFWETCVEGNATHTRFGRIGQPGSTSSKTFASPEAAERAALALVREKLAKGYQEVGAPTRWRPPQSYPVGKPLERFLDYPVIDLGRGVPDARLDADALDVDLRNAARTAYRLEESFEDVSGRFEALVRALVRDERVGELAALVIGTWHRDLHPGSGVEGVDRRPHVWLDRLMARSPKLETLRGLWIGDIPAGLRWDASYISHCEANYAPLVNALASLEEFVVRGSDLSLDGLAHSTLAALTVQCAHMPPSLLGELGTAALPSLSSLGLWFTYHAEENDAFVDALRSLLRSLLEPDRFPRLEHLAIQNAGCVLEVVETLCESPSWGRLKGLDLSGGNFDDRAAAVLMEAPGTQALKVLDVHHHFLSPGMADGLRSFAEAHGLELRVGASQHQAWLELDGEETGDYWSAYEPP